jgi:hypothetical protein
MPNKKGYGDKGYSPPAKSKNSQARIQQMGGKGNLTQKQKNK